MIDSLNAFEMMREIDVRRRHMANTRSDSLIFCENIDSGFSNSD